MSVLGKPWVAAAVARAMQATADAAFSVLHRRLAKNVDVMTIPASVAPARAVIYRPAQRSSVPGVHVNFHGGGFIMRGVYLDDPLCRRLAAEAGVVVVNVDYAVAPQHPFPAPARQAYEVVRWVAENGAPHGWDGSRLTIGGQSAGGGLAAAVARQALEQGGPRIALQVLQYAPLDLTIPPKDKPSPIAKPLLRPWMSEVFDNAYLPDRAMRADRLVSPAGPADTADLTGIAPALVITTEWDRLRMEGVRYAERLERAGALVQHHDVPGADHGYDMSESVKRQETHALIARRVRESTRVRE